MLIEYMEKKFGFLNIIVLVQMEFKVEVLFGKLILMWNNEFKKNNIKNYCIWGVGWKYYC